MLSRVYSWVKANWKWLLFPVGALLFLAGRLTSRRRPDVVAPELLEAEKEKQRLHNEAARQLQEAKKKRAEELARVKDLHAEALAKLTEEQRGKVDELKDDPEELNAYLLNVGKETRS